MSRSGPVLALVVLAIGCAPDSAPEPAAGAPLAVHFEVVNNISEDGSGLEAALTVTARGPDRLGRDWELYFNFPRMLFADSFPDQVVATHVNGDLFKLAPSASFAGLAPGDALRIPFRAQYWVIKESDAPAGFYLVSRDAEGRPGPPVIVEDVTVEPFLTPGQTRRSAGDQLPVPTPASRFARDRELTLIDRDAIAPILPTPLRLERGGGEVVLDASWTIQYGAGLEGEAHSRRQARDRSRRGTVRRRGRPCGRRDRAADPGR